MHEGSSSSIKEITSPHLGATILVPIAEKITPLAIFSERTNKTDFPDAMDTEEEDTTKNPKKQRVEEERQLVQMTKDKWKKMKQMKVVGFSCEVKEYAFADTPTNSTSQFKTKT